MSAVNFHNNVVVNIDGLVIVNPENTPIRVRGNAAGAIDFAPIGNAVGGINLDVGNAVGAINFAPIGKGLGAINLDVGNAVGAINFAPIGNAVGGINMDVGNAAGAIDFAPIGRGLGANAAVGGINPYNHENTTGNLVIGAENVFLRFATSILNCNIIMDNIVQSFSLGLAENQRNISLSVKTEAHPEIVTLVELDRNTGMTTATLDRGLDHNIIVTYNPPIISAAIEGSEREIESLLSAGCDVNTSATNGVTPLLAALSYNKKNALDLLLKKGANVNVQNNQGKYAIAIAMEKNLMDIVVKLVMQGAKLQDIGQAFLKQPNLISALSKAAHQQYDAILAEYDAKFELLAKKFNTTGVMKVYNITNLIKDTLVLLLSEMFCITITDNGDAVASKMLSLQSIAMKNLLKNLPEHLEAAHSKILAVEAITETQNQEAVSVAVVSEETPDHHLEVSGGDSAQDIL